jgi:hypothetical protein
MPTITLTVSEHTIAHAHQAASVLHRPVDEVLSSLLTAALGNIQDAPTDMQAELLQMVYLDTTTLWQMAQSQMPVEAQEAFQQLSQTQGEHSLTPDEQASLEAFRQDFARVTLRKARAYALLGLRSGTPLLPRPP